MDDWVKWSLDKSRTSTHCTGIWEIKLNIGIQVICCNTFQKKQRGRFLKQYEVIKNCIILFTFYSSSDYSTPNFPGNTSTKKMYALNVLWMKVTAKWINIDLFSLKINVCFKNRCLKITRGSRKVHPSNNDNNHVCATELWKDPRRTEVKKKKCHLIKLYTFPLTARCWQQQ